jgi:hypothetical protein
MSATERAASPAGSGSAPAGSDAAARTILAAMTPPVPAGSLRQNGDCFGEDVHRNGSGLRAPALALALALATDMAGKCLFTFDCHGR